MTGYTPPLQEMRFVLNELAGLDAIAELPGLEEATPDLVDAVLEEAGRRGSEVLVVEEDGACDGVPQRLPE